MLMKSRLDTLLKGFTSIGPAGCACSVSRGNETLYEGYFGYADLEKEKPITPDTIYRLYSMSKVITCTAALILYERGLYLMDDPLYEYLPEFKTPRVYRRKPNGDITIIPASGPIRIRHLFTMSSGLTYPGNDCETARKTAAAIRGLLGQKTESGKISVRALSKTLAAIPLAFEPGTHWKYGLSHDVIGALIEVLSGKRFGQFLKDEIFDPLGMKDTSFQVPLEKHDRLCRYYNRSENGEMTGIPETESEFAPDTAIESGGAGLKSSLGDYTRFCRMLVCGGTLDGVRILGRKTIDLMALNHLTPQQLADVDWPTLGGYGYGLGVRVMMNRAAGGCNGSDGEFGWNGMAGTWMMIDPKENLSAVYMQQLRPSMEEKLEPRLRAAIYGSI